LLSQPHLVTPVPTPSKSYTLTIPHTPTPSCRFEHLALEYDDEEIGDLEEQGEQIRGFADVAGAAGKRRPLGTVGGGGLRGFVKPATTLLPILAIHTGYQLFCLGEALFHP
jgi:hypothetical protein